MKMSLLKKMLSFVIVLTVVMSTFVTADAAAISSTTWSKDFEGIEDVSYDKWLDPADTVLDCTFYGSETSVLSIKSDTDTTHGKVMHIEVDANDTAERFVMFTIPKISSGKFVFEFDAKTGGSGMTFTANETTHSGYNGVVSMADNAIFGNVTYNVNEWKTFRILFDVDKKQITAYVDGESQTKTSNYATTQAMKFIIRPGSGGVSLDNLKLYPVSEASAEMKVLTDGEIRDGFVDYEASDLTLAISNSYFAAVPEITMTDLGTDILSDADDEEMSIEASYSNGNINVTLDDYLNEGSKYRISIPEGTTDMYGNVIENTSVEFYAAENNGWIKQYETYEDFNVTSVPTTAGRVGTTNRFYSHVANTLELLTGDSYPSGTAVKLKAGSHIETDGQLWKKGKVYLKTKIDVGMGSSVQYDTATSNTLPLFGGQQVVDLTGDGVNDESINFRYQAPANYPNAIWDRRKLKTGEMEEIEYIIDIDNLKSYITYNGEEFTLDTPYVTGNGVDIKNNGFQSFRLYAGNDNTMTIDYFNYWHEYLPATVKEIKFSNTAEGKVDVKSQIVITFSESMKEDTLSNITVSDGTSNATYTGVWDAAENTYTLTFDSKLNGETEYELTVPNTVKDFSNLPVYTACGTFTTAPVPPMDVDNLAAVRDGADVSVTADVTNAVDRIVYLIVAGYKDYILEAIEIVPITVTESTSEISHMVTLEETDVDIVKAFAFYDMATIRPYCAAATASGQ